MAAEIKPGAVAHIVNEMRPGGIETLVLDLGRRDPEDVAILSLTGSTERLVANWPALEPFASKLIGLERTPGLRPGFALRVARALRGLKPRAVVAHHVGPLLYGASAARLIGLKRVVHVEHDVWHYRENPRHATILKAAERVLRPIHIAVSNPIRDEILRLVPKASVVVAPPGIDTARFAAGDKAAARARLGAPMEAKIIGTAGRLAAVKAQIVLIEAMASLGPDTRCFIAGEGEERPALEAKIAELGLGERVTLLGHRDDLFEIMPAFDLFCLPSLNEGLPRVVLEAQACDIPVVASDVGALKDAVCPETGALTPAGDVAALAAALGERLASPPTPGETRRFAVERYDFEQTWRIFHEQTRIDAA